MSLKPVLKNFLPAISIFFALIVQSCSIKEPTAPNWDVSVNLPIVNKNYTLYDILEKKSGEIGHYTQGAVNNLLYFTQSDQIEKLDLENKIKIEPFSASESESLSNIEISSDVINADVNYDWLNSSLTPGSSAVVPPISNAAASVNLSQATQFQYIKISSGFIDVTFTNHFPSPVVTTINGFTIKDALNNSTVIQSTENIILQPQQTSAVRSYPITPGITVNNQLVLQFVISTNGSGGQKIIVPAHSLTVNASVRDLIVSEANAIIPKQNTITVNGSILVDQNSSQPNQFQTAKLDGGTLKATVTNNFNAAVNATFVIDNLKTPQGNIFSITQTIPPKSTVNIFPGSSVAGYSIISPSNSPTNQVTFHVNADLVPTNSFQLISGSDKITASINFQDLSVDEFAGRLKPTTIDQSRSSISLNVKDIQSKLQFAKIDLKNPKIELHLHPSANINFSLSGRITASNQRGEKVVITLNSRTMNKTIITPADSVITLNADTVSKFFGTFTQLPDSLIVYAGGIVNPNYDVVDVKKTDQFTGSGIIEIPFQFGLTGGVYSDSVKVDLSQDDRDRIKDVNTLQAGLSITNGIAAGVAFTGRLYDQFNNFLMYFPPKYQDQDTIVNVSGASTDADGNVSAPNAQAVTVKLMQNDAQKISNAAYMKIKLKFGTSDGKAANFKSTDVIKIAAFGSTDYHVNSK